MSSLPETLRSILSSASISNEIRTGFVSLASTIEQLRAKTNETAKEVEMVFNMPLQFGVGKGQSLENLLEKPGYGKLLFDHDRDLLASRMIYVNRNGSTCNMAVCAFNRTVSKVDDFLAKEVKSTKVIGADSIEEMCK
ncbi:hypothetical protein ANCCAN_14886 [Ancylostoma caninum]|uniref:Uncharacterized protein n=1 Tax=Ancylostoma caninum TaxID=29170 RepID=A0A368G4B7_ANCCA|nr:hypothetical protein ANCCAN_14886 [Ancylostoma caninum]